MSVRLIIGMKEDMIIIWDYEKILDYTSNFLNEFIMTNNHWHKSLIE
jgi:hypothetical protein